MPTLACILMSKKVYILLIVMIGFFLAPSFAYACGKAAGRQKACCREASQSEAAGKDCCKKDRPSKHKCGEDCSGKCKDTSCNCSTPKTNVVFPALKSIQYYPLFCAAKQSFTDAESYTLSGFCSVWLPPKIS